MDVPLGASEGIPPALRTDHYELTMFAAARHSGVADEPAVFELFARALPRGRRFGVVAGVGRLVELLEGFAFPPPVVDYLFRRGVVDAETADALAAWRFTGTVRAYPEGEVYTAWSPVVQVHAPFAEAVLVETLALSVLNHDTAVASAAARMRAAAGSRGLLDMGSRRVHEDAAVAAARAAWIGGVDATSNLAAGWVWGIPTAGTAAHAFTLAHEREEDAFAAQIVRHGVDTTLLVDTYDTLRGVARAVAAARAHGADGPGAVRVDSGDLRDVVPAVRRRLDELGAAATRVVVSGDVDEYTVDELADLPVDRFGVGTRLATGSGAPTAGFVFKLVRVGGRDVGKRSDGKATRGGVKHPWRVYDPASGHAVGDLVADHPSPPPRLHARPLHTVVVDRGRRCAPDDVAAARSRRETSVAELPPRARRRMAGPAELATWHHVDEVPDRLRTDAPMRRHDDEGGY